MVKKRPIPRLEDCIDTRGMFDGEESDSYLKELRDTINLTETVWVLDLLAKTTTPDLSEFAIQIDFGLLWPRAICYYFCM